MKTSNLKVHLTGGLQEQRIEPFAKLIYGNVEIQIPYNAFISLNLYLDRTVWGQACGLFDFAKHEITIEMLHDMKGKEQLNPTCWHRDNPQKCSLNHNWQGVEVRMRDADYIQTDSEVKPDYGK